MGARRFTEGRHRRSHVREGRLTRLCLSAVLVAGVLAGIVSLPPAVAKAATELQVPTTQPSPVRPVAMVCDGGQTDLNHAPLSALMAAVGVARPIAQRIVDSRPFNQPRDIIVVPGVGPGTPVEWAKLCVTPVTQSGSLVPDVSAEFCLPGDPRVDLAIAPAEVLTARRRDGGLGLGRPTAARLLAHRSAHPLPSVGLAAIVAGIGPGGLRQWSADTCLTPAPFSARTAAGNSYGADLFRSDTSRRLRLGTPGDAPFQLAVPAGTLTSPAAWGVIVDVPEAHEWQGNRADFHLHGDWQAPGHLVYVTVPSEDAPLDTVARAVTHIPSTGGQPEFLTGDRISIDVGAGTTTTALDSLSPVEASFVPMTYISAPTVTNRVTPADVAEAFNFAGQVLDYRTESPTCPASTATYGRTETVTGYYADDGEMLYCTWASATDGKMRVKFAFNRNFVTTFLGIPSGSGARFVGTAGSPSTPVGWGIQQLLGVGSGPLSRDHIAPGGSFEMELDPTSSSMTIDVYPDPLATAAYAAASRILDALDHKTVDLAETVVECVYPVFSNKLYRDGMSSAQAVGNLWDCIEPTLPAALKAVGKAGVSKALAAALLVTDGTVALYDDVDRVAQQFAAGFTGDDAIQVNYAVATPPTPLTDPHGRPYHPGCIELQFDPAIGAQWEVDASCQDAVYGSPIPPPTDGSSPPPGEPVRPSGLGRTDGTVGNVPNGMTDVLVRLDDGRRGLAHDGSFYLVRDDAVWTCLTDRYPVYWSLDSDDFGDWFPHGTVQGPGYCSPQTVGRWLGESLRNWIVRDTNGDAVLLDGSGVVHPIQDGGCFLQLAHQYLVQDHVLDAYVGMTGGLSYVDRPVGPDACG